MKKLFVVLLLIICFSTITALAIFKVVKEKDFELDVDCVKADTFHGTASEIYKSIKTSKCGIKVDDTGLTFIKDGTGNFAKYDNVLYYVNIIKKDDYQFVLTNVSGARVEADPLKRIESGEGTDTNPYIIK